MPQPNANDEPMLPHGRDWLEAARRGDQPAMQAILAAHPEVLSYRGKGCSLGFIGHTALHWAAAKGSVLLLDWLLERGADPNLGNNAGSTALHVASQNGQAVAAERLLSAGAEVDAKDDEGFTPGDVAQERGHRSLVAVLAAQAGRAALCARLSALAATAGGWRVGEMREALRLGAVSTAGVTEKSELEALVRELMAREGVPAAAPPPTAAPPPEATPPPPPPPPPPPLASDSGSDSSDDAEAAARMKAAAERAKANGNERFGARDYDGALHHFSVALRLDARSHVLHSNRSAALAALGRASEALADADRCVELAPQWAKGHSRRAAALELLGSHADALRAYEAGLEVEPQNAALLQGLERLSARLRGGEGGEHGRAGGGGGDKHGVSDDTGQRGGGDAQGGGGKGGGDKASRAARPVQDSDSDSDSGRLAPRLPPAACRAGVSGDAAARWIDAAKRADRPALESILAAAGSDVVHATARGIGHTALHWCAAKGEVRVMEWLLSVGAVVNATNASDATALHTAAGHGQAFAVSLLLRSGVDTALRDDDGRTASEVAAGRGRADLARQIEAAAAEGAEHA